jgi:hypothetical protein
MSSKTALDFTLLGSSGVVWPRQQSYPGKEEVANTNVSNEAEISDSILGNHKLKDILQEKTTV